MDWSELSSNPTFTDIGVRTCLFPAIVLLLLLLEELCDDKLLGVCCCLGLPASAKIGVAADARVPWAILLLVPAVGQLLAALLPDARAAIWAGDVPMTWIGSTTCGLRHVNVLCLSL
jgi:hypothetical protein